jgi:opacity protein-like surface antigen
MKKILTLALLAIFASGPAFAADTKAPATVAAEAQMTPQQEKMKTCNDKAKDMKGDDRKGFMKTCLSAKPEKPKSKMAMCNEKTKGMTKVEADKTRSECMKG